MSLTQETKRAKELRQMLSGIPFKKRIRGVDRTKVYVPAKMPLKGQDYFTPEDQQSMKTELLNELKTHLAEMTKQNIEVTPELAKKIVEGMAKLPETDRLDIQHIRNFQSFVYGGTKYGVHEMMHGGAAATSVAATQVYGEVVSGSGTTFTLAHTPDSGTVRLYAIGQRLTVGAGNDYTIAGAVITAANSWSAGQILADYSYT